jgi:hypothetical protein
MTRSDLAKRMATFIVMVVAGFFLGTYLDQRFTAPNDVEPAVTWNDSAQPGRPVPASAGDDG